MWVGPDVELGMRRGVAASQSAAHDDQALGGMTRLDKAGNIGERANGADRVRRGGKPAKVWKVDAPGWPCRRTQGQSAVAAPEIGRMPGLDPERPGRAPKQGAAAAEAVHD